MAARSLLFGGLKALEGTEPGSDACKVQPIHEVVFNP